MIYEKYSNTKFHENPSSGTRIVPSGWTDRNDEANSPYNINNQLDATMTIY